MIDTLIVFADEDVIYADDTNANNEYLKNYTDTVCAGLEDKINSEIGLPIACLSNNLNDNEIWLEGAEVSKTAYAALYAVYGDTYNLAPAPAAGNFKLPDLRNRALWGSDSFGYMHGTLPRIAGTIANVTGAGSSSPSVTGAFSVSNFVYNNGYGTSAGGGNNSFTIGFSAYNSSGVYGSDTELVRPTCIRCRFKTRYK